MLDYYMPSLHLFSWTVHLRSLLLLVLICIQPYHVISFSSPSHVLISRISRITSSVRLDLVDDSKEKNIIHCADRNYSRLLDAPNERRLFLLSSVSVSSFLGVTAVGPPAFAAKGAAEYDLEYYMRDLLMGNNREGNLPVSNAPPPHTPRKLHGQLLPLLLDDDLQSCIPILELSQISKIPSVTLSEQIRDIRTKVKSAFKTAHPWEEELIRDEYYFDLTCYAIWRTASSVIAQDFVRRDLFMRNIGRRFLNEMLTFLSKESFDALNSKSDLTLTGSVPCVIEILNAFQSSNYCTGYRLGDKNDEVRSGLKVFDTLDDDEIAVNGGGGSVDCLVSIYDPATLGGALQINGEGSRFVPDFIGPILAAVWERVNGDNSVTVSFDSYFVDPIYRPNPKDFFPNERFYQFTMTRKT